MARQLAFIHKLLFAAFRTRQAGRKIAPRRAREVRIKEQTNADEVIAFIRVGNLAQNHRKSHGREAGHFELLPWRYKIPGYTALREINPTNVPWPPDANARRTCEASGVTEFAEVDILFVRIVTLHPSCT